MNLIQQEVLNAWTSRRKTKRSQSGWISGNAVCCNHNGHNIDSKGRGGILPTVDQGISWHCFNCGFTAGWQPGRRITLKMRKLLGWMGVSEDEIRRLSLFALSNLDTSLDIKKEVIKELPKFECKEVCPGQDLIDWFIMEDINAEDMAQAEAMVSYLDDRGIGNKIDYFKWHNNRTTHMYNSVLIPFTWLCKEV